MTRRILKLELQTYFSSGRILLATRREGGGLRTLPRLAVATHVGE